MSEAIEKVARAIAVAAGVHDERLDKDWPLFSGYATAAVNCLADNVTDEMVRAFREQLEREPRDKWLPALAEGNAIAAALRSLTSQP